MKLAEVEGTRAVFKRGVYEVLKLLAKSIEDLFRAFEDEETMKKAMVRNLWTVLRPMVSHSEGRLMKANMMGHETVRHFGSVLDDAVPPPKGDWGWPLRRCQDLAAISVRMFAQLYLRAAEDAEAFVRRAMSLVRLYMEEAVRRMLMFTAEANMRLGGIVTTQ